MISETAMNEISEVLVLGGVFATGVLGSVVYYFARFFLFPDDDSVEVKKTEIPEKKVKNISLSEALAKSRKSIWSKSGGAPLSSLEDLEESLYLADIGPQTVSYLTEQAQEKLKGQAFDIDAVKKVFKDEILEIFSDNSPSEKLNDLIQTEQKKPHVIAIVGVNGAGKTTTIGKLAHYFAKNGKKVMVAAGDTFRAAAEEQLNVWAERSKTLIFKAADQTKDPGAVAFQAYEKALKEEVEILIIDTAGRLHTQGNLMQELEKVKRVLAKKDPDLPQDLWMILDANTGMNALHQADAFHKSLSLSGVIMTKVDGSAKAGMAIGVKKGLNVPILMLGMGEGIEDIKIFSPKEYVESLV